MGKSGADAQEIPPKSELFCVVCGGFITAHGHGLPKISRLFVLQMCKNQLP
jgi:hypothetical protein